MAQKYYNSAETAKILGKTVDEIKRMLEHRELHGYRDGADWKFKVEDIDLLAKQLPTPAPAADEDGGGDVLLSEVALGQSDPGLSGTVIGLNAGGQMAANSMGESDLAMSALSGDSNAPVAKKKSDSDPKVAKATKFEELGLNLEEKLTLDDSSVVVGNKPGSGGSSTVDLGGGKEMDDDDLVLGGSGASSDVTIGGDSGISLVDPSDSGFSLETPINLGSAAEESLELGEDDMLVVDEASRPGAAALKPDDDFLLTPLEETIDADGSESGSQVIALDVDGEDSATMIGSAAGVSMAAMLDEDLSAQPALDMGMGGPLVSSSVLGAQPGALAEGAALMQPSAALAEPPYTGWQIAGLSCCLVLLILCGMMMYDLLRSMWSWEQPFTINSQLMDTILGWIGM